MAFTGNGLFLCKFLGNGMSRKYTYVQEQCIRLAGKLSQTTGMLHPGARVGIAVSGGVDSWVLLKVMLIRQSIVPFPFEIMALHINPGFCAESHAPLAAWLKENGVSGHIELTDHGPLAHSPQNRKKSPCFLCAMLRRKRLFELCRQYRLTHLAMGHNFDDLASTFFMNMLNGGRIDGLAMKESFFQGSLTMIRPLLLVKKALILKAAKAWNLPIWDNPCPSSGKTGRSEAIAAMEALCGHDRNKKANLFTALTKWQLNLTQASKAE